jgi:hypothetical protein
MAWSTKQSEVDIMLRFSLDEEAQRRVNEGISSVGDELAKIQQQVADESAEKNAHEARMKRLKAEVAAASQVQSSWRRMQFTARSLFEVAQITALASSAIFVGAAAWATKYVNDAKASTLTVRAWRVEVDKLKTSQARVGEVLATALLPMLEKAADLAAGATAFVEKNPDLIRAGLNTVGVVAAIAAIGVVAAKGFKIYADIGYAAATAKQVAAAAIYASAADVELIAANTHMAAATLEVTGALPSAAIKAATLPAELAMREAYIAAATTSTASTIIPIVIPLVIAALVAGGFALMAKGIQAQIDTGEVGPVEDASGRRMTRTQRAAATARRLQANDFQPGASQAAYDRTTAGAAANAAEAAKVNAAYLDMITKNSVDMYVAWQAQITTTTAEYVKQRAALETQYEKQRTETVAQYAKQRAEAEAAYDLNTSRSMRDFALSESQIEEDYFTKRTSAAATYGEDALRAEQDHLREMRKLLEDHNDRVEGFAATRDALGYAREMRDYERARRDAEEEYAIEQSRKNRDYARTLRDNEKQFARERAQRLAQFNLRMADDREDHDLKMAQMQADHDETMAKLAADHVDELAEQAKTYDDQIKMLEESFQARLRLLDASIFGDLVAVEATAAANTAAFRAYMQAAILSFAGIATPTPTNRRAGGGYADYGKYWLGEGGREFVLDNKSTKLAEKSLGGQLSQERLMAAMLGSSRGGYNDHRTLQFNGMTAADRDWTRSLVTKVAEQTIVDATRIQR